MQPVQPHNFTPLCTEWRQREQKAFAITLSEMGHPLFRGKTLKEKCLSVLQGLMKQEKELLSLPNGRQIAIRIPARPDQISFYSERQTWLDVHNKIQFWKLLPGGEAYLESIESSKETAAEELAEWMQQSLSVKSVTRLDVRVKSGITRLPAEIALCMQLNQLLISSELVQEVPPEIWHLILLEKLHIWSPQIKEMPAILGRLVHLTSLSIKGTSIRSLDAEIVQLQNLTSLDVSQNKLESIEFASNLEGLFSLHASNNRLTSFPSRMPWKKITGIWISSNFIQHIPEEVYSLTSLTILCVSHNRIREISEKISQLTQLRTLALGYNQLTNLPVSIASMPSRMGIHIDNNPLIEVPGGVHTYLQDGLRVEFEE